MYRLSKHSKHSFVVQHDVLGSLGVVVPKVIQAGSLMVH